MPKETPKDSRKDDRMVCVDGVKLIKGGPVPPLKTFDHKLEVPTKAK
jgi:hypothetical protein